MPMLAQCVLSFWVCLHTICLSVCLFFVKIGIVPKGLNLGSGKRRKYDRPRKSSFLLPKIYMRNSNLLTPNLDTKIGGGGFSTNISLSIPTTISLCHRWRVVGWRVLSSRARLEMHDLKMTDWKFAKNCKVWKTQDWKITDKLLASVDGYISYIGLWSGSLLYPSAWIGVWTLQLSYSSCSCCWFCTLADWL